MVVLVVISGNELILGMSLMKMLKRIGPSIDPYGTRILNKNIGTCKSEMPGNSVGNNVKLYEFHSLLICNGA